MPTSGESILPPLDRPSQQIRLIKFQPGRHNASCLDLDITVWPLEKLPDYHAISYTWGSPADIASISINGQPFQVRHNCYYSLWQVRQYFPHAYIWMDSICIDQATIDEKNQQVQMMGHIYSSAKSVLACVGPHADGSEQLVQRRVMKEPEEYRLKSRAWMWKILKAFWQRPYWERLWIVQELELAKEVTILCGEHVLEFSDLSLLPWRDDWTDHLPGIPGFVLQVIRGIHGRKSLWDTIFDHTHQKCKDPRDHVYAILALYAPEPTALSHDPIKVDYAISLPALALEVVKRLETVTSYRFGTQFLDVLRCLDLCSGPRLSAMETFRNSIICDSSNHSELDDQLLAACWDSFPMTKELPHIFQHLPRGCRAATFAADPKGRLMVRPFRKFNDLLPPTFRSRKGTTMVFSASPDLATQVEFDASIDESVYSLTARVTSMARPGDLLLRTGQHIYGDVAKTFATGLREANSFTVGGPASMGLNVKDLERNSPEEFVVIRWMGPGLWKVIGQAYITGCILRPTHLPAVESDLCFDSNPRNFEVFYSLMSTEATFLQWTHCLALQNTPEEKRIELLDEIVSLPPPSSYYYMPEFDTRVEECRKRIAPDWQDRYWRKVTLGESRSQHLWFSEMARDFKLSQTSWIPSE